MTTQVSEHAHPIARPITHRVTSSTVSRNRRAFGRFGGTREPTVRGHAPDILVPILLLARTVQ